MKVGERLIRNTSFIFISSLAVKLISVLFVAYAARVLGPKDFGVYALVGTFTIIISHFTNFGITPMAIREIAVDKGKAEEFFNNVLSLRMCLTAVSYFLLFVVVNIMSYSQEIKTLIYLMGASLIFSTFSGTFRILYMAYERMAVPSSISVLTSLLSSISGAVVLYLGYGIKGLVVIGLAGSSIGALISGIWIRKRFLKYRFGFNAPLWLDILKKSLPFGLITFLSQIDRYLTILLLSKLNGPVPKEMAIGYYNSASSTSQAALMIPMSIKVAALPTISSNMGNPEIIRSIIDRSTKYILLFVTLPLILATTFFPTEIVTILFGKAYLPAAPALTLLGWAYGFMSLNSSVFGALTSDRDINRFIPWAVSLLAINIVIAVPLILYYSFIGAAVAGLCIKVIGTFVRYHLLKSVLGIGIFDLRESNRVFIPAVSILVAVWLTSKVHLSQILLLFSIVIFYVGFLYFFKVFRNEEIASFKKALRISAA